MIAAGIQTGGPNNDIDVVTPLKINIVAGNNKMEVLA
jgi:hypothetical protein